MWHTTYYFGMIIGVQHTWAAIYSHFATIGLIFFVISRVGGGGVRSDKASCGQGSSDELCQV